MAAAKQGKSCCKGDEAGTVCRLEGLIGVDERGQMVLPKELRDRIGLRAGEKLALVSWERDSDVCCLVLMRAEGLAEMVRESLEPLFSSREMAVSRSGRHARKEDRG